jgi:hypothetical protein
MFVTVIVDGKATVHEEVGPAVWMVASIVRPVVHSVLVTRLTVMPPAVGEALGLVV